MSEGIRGTMRGTWLVMATRRTLSEVYERLLERHGAVAGPGLDDPFQLILWEQVAYLVDDERRRAAFDLLARRVGLTPQAILAAPPELLAEVAAAGGAIAGEKRAERMRESARMVVAAWAGDLRRALALPLADAKRALARFPMIGKPGVEKVLLLTRTHPVLALDSNGLRVLLRLGYGEEGRRYEQTYASVRAAVAGEIRADCDWLITLRELLRRHGQLICRNNRPACPECPLARICAYYAGQH
jgi:endonuclease III